MNLFDDIPASLPDELIQTLARGENVRIERIVSQGHVSPEGFWYDQPQDEWVVLLHGAARLQFAEETLEMQPADTVLIPAHRRHRVVWTSPTGPTIWLAVHFGALASPADERAPT